MSNKLPNAGDDGTKNVGSSEQVELGRIPEDALQPATVSIQNLEGGGSLYVKLGAKVNDRVSTDDFGFKILPNEAIDEDLPKVGRVLIISDYTPTGRNVAFSIGWRKPPDLEERIEL